MQYRRLFFFLCSYLQQDFSTLQEILSELLQEYPQVSSNSTLPFGVLMMQAKYLAIC